MVRSLSVDRAGECSVQWGRALPLGLLRRKAPPTSLRLGERVSDFPVDDATLVMLAAACEINPDTGRTHLHDFLDMGTRVKSHSLIGGDPEGDTLADAPIYEVEFEEGYEPYSEHQVIRCLVAEIQRLRAATNHSQAGD